MHDFQSDTAFLMQGTIKGNGSPFVEYCNMAVETLYRSRRAGLQAIDAALDVIDLEQSNPPTSAPCLNGF